MIAESLASGFGALAIGVQLASVSVAAWRCHRKSRKPMTLPAVSLLRPICGNENFLAETLGSTFRLDVPDYEILFCAARPDDPAVAIVRQLIEANPQVPARLLIGDDGISANPKLGNLVKGWDAARHEWIIIADSNVLMPPDFVQRLLAAWKSDSGVVCSMPIGARPGNFWAELECAFLNTLQARFQYVSEALGWGFAQGKAMLFRRDIVERAGGIRALPPRLPRMSRRQSSCAPRGCASTLSTCLSSSPSGTGKPPKYGAGSCAGRGCGESAFRCCFSPNC
jgi:ceramide glucosyltransferase